MRHSCGQARAIPPSGLTPLNAALGRSLGSFATCGTKPLIGRHDLGCSLAPAAA